MEHFAFITLLLLSVAAPCWGSSIVPETIGTRGTSPHAGAAARSGTRAADGPHTELGQFVALDFYRKAKDASFRPGTLITFTPILVDGQSPFALNYSICWEEVDSPPTSLGGFDANITDLQFRRFTLPENTFIFHYGFPANVFYVHDDGFLTLRTPQWSTDSVGGSLVLPTIGPVIGDLDPGVSGARVNVKITKDGAALAVTYKNVPQWRRPKSKMTFQMLIYFETGVIQFYYKTKVKMNEQFAAGISPGFVTVAPSSIGLADSDAC